MTRTARSALFPHHGESREDQTRARKLGRRLCQVVQVALGLPTGTLEVRVSRRWGVGPYLILWAPNRSEVRPWSWPLAEFVVEDELFLNAGRVPEIVAPVVTEWQSLFPSQTGV